MAIRIIFIIVLIFTACYSSAQEFYPEPVAKKAILKTLKEKDISVSKRIELSDSDSEGAVLLLYVMKRNSEEQEFYAVFRQAKGRYEWFDYLLILSLDFKIEKIKILKYRSEYGGEIASKKWLQQFQDYSFGELEYGKDISALSGATISANALVKDIPKVLKMLREKY